MTALAGHFDRQKVVHFVLMHKRNTTQRNGLSPIEMAEREKANQEFYDGNICDIYFPSYLQMNEFVVSICKQNGVTPCAQNSINSDCVRYFCKCSGFPKEGSHYSCKTGCKFYVITTKTKQGYHISSLDARHNHILGPKSIPLSHVIQQEIICYHSAGFQPKQIAKILEVKGIFLSTNDIALITYKNRAQNNENEYQELEQYMIKNNGVCIPFDIMDENGEEIRCAIWTQTQDEKRNLEEFSSVILFDSTSTNLNNGWLSIPISVLDKNRHIRPAGLCFLAFETSQTLEFMLSNLFSNEKSRNNRVIITDEDQSYSYPISKLSHNPFHVLCCSHKMKNFIKLLNSVRFDKQTKEELKKLFSKICYSNNIQIVEKSFEE